LAPTIEGEYFEILKTSCSTSKIDYTSLCSKSHRSSIFPPTLGTLSVPIDLPRDYTNNSKLNQSKLCEKIPDSYKGNIFYFIF
jgi:hypothetical protein